MLVATTLLAMHDGPTILQYTNPSECDHELATSLVE